MPTSQSSSKGDVHLHFRHHWHCWKNILKMIGILLRMRNENCDCLPSSALEPRTIGPSGAESRVHTLATYRHYCRHYQIGHLHAPPWFRTRSPRLPPRAFSHIILGQLLGIPDSSADVTPQFGRRWVMRGSPRFSADLRLAISEIAAAPPFCPTSPTAY